MPGGIFWQVASKGTTQFYGDHPENPVMGWSQPPNPPLNLFGKTIRVEIGWPSPLQSFVRWSFSKGLLSCQDYASGPVLSIIWVVICPVQPVQPWLNECYGCERFIFMHGSEIDFGVDCSICGFPGYATYVNILYCLHHRLTYLKWDNNRIEDGTSSDFALICFVQEANIFSESLGWSNNLASVTHNSLRWFHCCPYWTLVHFDSPNSIHMSWFLLIWGDRA